MEKTGLGWKRKRKKKRKVFSAFVYPLPPEKNFLNNIFDNKVEIPMRNSKSISLFKL
jgi:hypothetical protein